MARKRINPIIPDKEEIERLKESEPRGVLFSIYLPNSPKKDVHTVWDSLCHSKKMEVEASKVSGDKKNKILKGLEIIDDYIKNDFNIEYFRTLVIFSKNGKNLRVYDIPVLLEKGFKISNKYYITSITEEIKKDGPTFVALIDRTKTEFFSMNWYRFSKDYGLKKFDVPKKVRGGTASWKGLKEKNIFLHIEWHFHEHMKDSANELYKIYRKEKFKKLIIGGHKNSMKKFEQLLRPELKRIIIERFKAEPDVFLREVKKDGMSAIDRHKLQK